MALTQEKKKQILAGTLFVALLGVFYYEFFSGDDGPPTTARPAAAPKKSSTQAQTAKGATAPSEPLISTALDLASMSDKAQTGVTGRNIFVYPPPPTPTPPPPPPPPPPPTPPPPITLVGVSPSGVIARTADFTLTVMGAKIPADAKTFINGIPYPTTFVSETQVKVAVKAATIAAPGPLRIEVRSAQDAKMYSNAVNLNVSAPPNPPYKYMALVVKDGIYSAVVKFDLDEETQVVIKGKILGGHWRITNITQEAIEILDTNINVSHSIKFTGEGG